MSNYRLGPIIYDGYSSVTGGGSGGGAIGDAIIDGLDNSILYVNASGLLSNTTLFTFDDSAQNMTIQASVDEFEAGLFLKNPTSTECNSPALWFKHVTRVGGESNTAQYWRLQGVNGNAHDQSFSLGHSQDASSWNEVFSIANGGRLSLYGDIIVKNDNSIQIGADAYGVNNIYVYNLTNTVYIETDGINPLNVSGGLSVTEGDLSNKAHIGFYGSDAVSTTAAIQTTDDTTTTLWSYTLADDTVYSFEASVVARDGYDGYGHAMFGKKAMIYRQTTPWTVNDGYATLEEGADVDLHPDFILNGYDLSCSFAVSGNDVHLTVTGPVSPSEINWAATIKYQGVWTA